MSGFLTDLRFGLRQLAAKPGFATAAILTLALGIGANTAVFSVLSGYLFKPLPYPHAGRLAQVNVALSKLRADPWGVSLPIYQIINKQTQVFAATGIYERNDFNLSTDGRAQHVGGGVVSASLFHVLGVQPLLGRTFTKANMRKGGNQVAVISYALWRTAFGANPKVIGKTVKIEGKVFKIIGVMPRGFAFPDRDISIWLPRTMDPQSFRANQFLYLGTQFIGWLKPGVSLDAAQRQVQHAVNAWIHVNLPVARGKKGLQSLGFTMQARSYRQALLGNRPATLWLLQGAVLLILLITCVNVANLLLSRILGRSHEIAIRSTLGATRGRLARQLLDEALCLAVPGGLVGVALAWLGLHFLAKSALGSGQSIFSIALDWRVGLFALGAAVFTAALVSVLPIRHLAKTDLQIVLQEGSRTSGSGRRAKRVRNALVILELGLATALLAGSGLLIHSFIKLQAVSPGFNPNNVLTARITVPPGDHQGTKALANFYDQLADRMEALPGVTAAGFAMQTPLHCGRDISYTIPGRSISPKTFACYNAVSGDYFKALGLPMLSGRQFDPQDTQSSEAVVIIDRLLAQKYFPEGNAVGHYLFSGEHKTRIVGVVPTIKIRLDESVTRAMLYFPVSQGSWSRNLGLVIHTIVPPQTLIRPLTELVSQIDPLVAVSGFKTMHQVMSDRLQDRHATMFMVLAFGAIALALAIVGVYAVMSYAVGQRRAECGVRLALGALPEDLSWLILRDGLKLLVVGLGIGLGLAVLFGYLLSAQLFGVAPFDPMALTGSAVVLAAITLVACWLPARRAAKLDPAVAMMEQ